MALTGPLASFGETPFDPDFTVDQLSRQAKATLGREWLLHGHLQDRAGMPLYLGLADLPAMEQLAIDEWMTASPIYSKRMQKALRFPGDGMSTIFKNLQLDIGAPHQFMDFRFRLDDEAHGEFWLAHCGALMDVEPMGPEFVTGMCHHIEDPTFDATAGATNPRAQVRPIHRPPRVPTDRRPHCHWTVAIDAGFPAAAVHPNLAAMQASPLARFPVVEPAPTAGEPGRGDYSGPFDPDFTLEDLSATALDVALREFAVQSHLLARAYMLAVSRRLGDDVAAELGRQVMVGQAGITAERLVRATSVTADRFGAADALAHLLQIHPTFQPGGLLGMKVSKVGPATVEVSFSPDPDAALPDPLGVMTVIDQAGGAVLEATGRAVDRRFRWRPGSESSTGGAFVVGVDTGQPPSGEPSVMTIIRLSTGADFRFVPIAPKA